jgi:hypothetical protein
MTYQRVVNRNHLNEGGYGDPGRHAINVNLGPDGYDHREDPNGDAFTAAIFPHAATRLRDYERAFTMLLGDLRRLEHDAVDENVNGVCGYIAQRTGIESEVVAAVLKEFMAW